MTELIETNERLKLEIQKERVKLDQARGGTQFGAVPNTNNSLNDSNDTDGSSSAAGGGKKESSSSASSQVVVVAGTHGALALKQGIVIEKVGKSAGERIVRLSGDVLEWRKGNGRFSTTTGLGGRNSRPSRAESDR